MKTASPLSPRLFCSGVARWRLCVGADDSTGGTARFSPENDAAFDARGIPRSG